MNGEINKIASSDLINKKVALTHLKKDLKDRQENLNNRQSYYEDLKKKMSNLDDESVTLETRAEQV